MKVPFYRPTTGPEQSTAAEAHHAPRRIAHEEKKTTRAQCQTIYFNLLQMMDANRSDVPSSIFLHELEQTRRCDKIAYDLSQLRADYATYKEKVKNTNEGQDDEWVAACTVGHYGDWTKTKLTEALDWPNWVYYTVIYKWERTVGVLGVFGGGLAGAKLIGRSMRLSAARKAKTAKEGKEVSELS